MEAKLGDLSPNAVDLWKTDPTPYNRGVRRQLAAGAGLALGLAVVLHSQGQSSPAQAPPVFRGGVDYVELDVVVTDRHDVAVKDLTKDDLRSPSAAASSASPDFRFEYVPPTRRPGRPGHARCPPSTSRRTRTRRTAGSGCSSSTTCTSSSSDSSRRSGSCRASSNRCPQTIRSRSFSRAIRTSARTSRATSARRFARVNRIKDSLGFAENPPSSFDIHAAPANCGMRFFNARSSLYVLSNVAAALSRSSFPRRTLVFVSQGLDYDPFEPQLNLANLSSDPGTRIKAGATANASPNVSTTRDRRRTPRSARTKTRAPRKSPTRRNSSSRRRARPACPSTPSIRAAS